MLSKFYDTTRPQWVDIQNKIWVTALDFLICAHNCHWLKQLSIADDYIYFSKSKLTTEKHQLNMFWGFSRISWKSGFRLKNPVLGSDVKQCKQNTLKHLENTNKTCFEPYWEIIENPVLGSKMWFSAQISNYAQIPGSTQKTPTKHVLRLFKKFLKIRFSAQKSSSRPRCRTML